MFWFCNWCYIVYIFFKWPKIISDGSCWGSDEPKPNRKDKEWPKLNIVTSSKQRDKRASDQKSSSPPHEAIYREEEVIVYIYSIGRVKYYKKVPKIYKLVSGYYN